MARIRAPFPVKLFIGVLTAHQELLESVLETLTGRYGPTDHQSGIIPFNFTDYYESEMGSPLVKKLWSFGRLIEPDRLAEIKKETNSIEDMFAADSDTARPVNLDPGYVTPAKVVLATAKDFPHRIYLGEGVYAEVTLTYESKEWHSHRWTYADYKQDSYREFFSKIRTILLGQLKDNSPES
ncbi:MAG: DUF4416 family protein [Planctomycetota bacterium]|nr:MAG: DUF4416 family protein [Planctomycetota bacterium]